jgi:hypothetical protein
MWKEVPMKRIRRHRTIFIRPLVLLALLVTTSGVALAQDGTVEIPENAHAKSYGSGWECDQGYRDFNDACKAVQVPASAYSSSASSSYGRGWECDHGYRAVDEACVAVKVPANGYLTADSAFGPGWQCDRAYRAVDKACVAVKVPETLT